jgi:hypothetical protein
VKRFRTDGSGDYTLKKFAQCLKSEGILEETTTPYIAEFIGVIERAKPTIVEHIQCMLDDARLHKKYCAFALAVAVYFKNQTPT